MTPLQKKFFTVFKGGLLLLPAFFLLYQIKLWFWFLVPLPTNALEYITGFFLIFWLIGQWKLNFPRPQLSSKWQTGVLSFFLLASTIATIVIVLHLEQGRATPLGIWKGWFMAPATYFLMIISTFKKPSELRMLIEVTLGIMGLTAGVLVLQYFTGWFSDVMATYDNRLVWPYLDPLSGQGLSGNYPALYLAPFLCLAWTFFVTTKKGLDKTYYAAVILMMITAVYFSKSYGAWIAIVGACALSSFFLLKGKQRWIAVPLVTLAVVALMYVDQRNTEKFQFAVDTSEEVVISSGSERLNIWKVSWDLIKRDPLWGVGPGQFQRAFERQSPYTLEREVSRKEINHALHPHNTFLMFWLSNGMLGLLSFISLLMVLLVLTPKDWRWYLFAPLAYYLAHGLIDVFYWKNDLAFSFWLIVAMFMIAQNSKYISGKVEHGIKKGRELGFPTANIQLDVDLDKDHGVYTTVLKIENEKYKGLLYYGPRKTEGLPESIVCEITIFDFDEDIYNKKVSFSIGKFIRGPKTFNSLEELKEQIQKDVLVAKNIKY